MKTLTIHLRDTWPEANEFSVSGNVRAITFESIKRVINNNLQSINRWLAFGWAIFDVTDDETGEIIAHGDYEYNAFSGRGNYNLKMF